MLAPDQNKTSVKDLFIPRIVQQNSAAPISLNKGKASIETDKSQGKRQQNLLLHPGTSLYKKGKSTVVHPAKYINQSPPRYPHRAWELGQQGKVILHVLVGPQGQPLEWEVHVSSGYVLLDEAAIVAVKDWEFEVPKYTSKGAHIHARWVEAPILFQITN